jgi:hypothetical protein
LHQELPAGADRRHARGESRIPQRPLPFHKKAREFQFAPIRDYAHAFRFPEQYQFFCFVRNPYARLRSAWQNKFAYGHTQGWSRSIRRRELGRLRHFARAAGLPGGADGAAIPFETFLAYVESQPAGTRDHHWDDQYHVLLMDHIRYQRWFRMEGEFTAGMRQVFERIGLAGPVMERILTTQKNISPRGATCTPRACSARTPSLRAKFAAFGYEEDPGAAKPLRSSLVVRREARSAALHPGRCSAAPVSRAIGPATAKSVTRDRLHVEVAADRRSPASDRWRQRGQARQVCRFAPDRSGITGFRRRWRRTAG